VRDRSTFSPPNHGGSASTKSSFSTVELKV